LRDFANDKRDRTQGQMGTYIFDKWGRDKWGRTFFVNFSLTKTKGIKDNRTVSLSIKVVSGLSSANALEAEGQTVTYAYDSLGRMVRTTTPDGKSETAEYDLQGRLTKSTDKANQNTIFTYDAFDNILTKQTGSEAVTYTYNLLGLRTSMTDSTGTTLYEYSPYGELTKDTKGDIIKTYTYDLNSNPVTFDLMSIKHTIIF